MRTIAMSAAALAALALLAAGAGSSNASTLPGSPSGAPAAKFSGCLVTNDSGGLNTGLNKVSWQGMKAAAAAEPTKIAVKYLLSSTASDYVPNINTFIAEKCGLIVTVGSPMATATELTAKDNPTQKFAIVDCSYATGCLTGTKLKNITSVKGTVTAVKTVVIDTANGT